MNTIFSSLNKGVSGLKASEIQIDVTGNNIANANSTFYTRQRAIQTTGLLRHTKRRRVRNGNDYRKHCAPA